MKKFFLKIAPSIIPYIFLAMPLLLIFWQVITKGFAYINGDNFDLNIPLGYFLIDSIKNHIFPFWNPYIFTGIPFAADLNLGIFNPLNLLYFFFSSARALTLQSILDLFLIGIFQYLFLRQIKFPKLAALIGAIVFMLSGSVFSFTGNIAVLHPIVYIPLLFLFAKRYVENKNTRNFIYVVFIQFLQVISGHPQITYYTIFFICLFFLFYLKGNLLRKVILIGSYISLSLMLSSFLLLPFFQYVLEANRPTSSLAYATTGSFTLPRLLIVFFPTFFGTKLAGNWWGVQAMLLGYIGVAPLLLLWLGISKGKFAHKTFYILSFLLSFLLSFGKLGIIYFFFYYLIPGWSSLRSPGDLIVMTTFFASVVVAGGFTSLPTRSKRFLRTASKLFVTSSILCLIFLLLLFITNNYISWITVLKFFQVHHMPFVGKLLYYSSVKIISILNGAMWNCIIFLFFLALSFFLLAKVKNGKRFIGFCFLILITIDLLLADRTYLQLAPQSFYKTNAIANAKSLQDPNYRIYAKPIVIPQDRRFLPGSQYFYLQSQLNLQNGTDDHAASSHILSITGYAVLVLKRYAEYFHSENITGIALSQITQKQLNELSVRYILSQGEDNHLKIVENTSALPRAHLASTGSATILSSTPNRIIIVTRSKTKNTLILSDAFYPGWEVFINGEKSTITPYANVFREVYVPSGESVVIFSYNPVIWKIGAATSCIGFLMCIFLLMYKKSEK